MRFLWVLSAVCLGVLVACSSRPGSGVTPQVAGDASLRAAAASPSPTPIPIPSATYSLLYSFKKAPDGAHPAADLIALNGTLYGTTEGGGSHCRPFGCGTVFAVTPTGVEGVLTSFDGGRGGSVPLGPLATINGELFGTTYEGGRSGDGTVFKVSTRGRERVLYSFDGPHGAAPAAGMILLDNFFYGTTYAGGNNTDGVVFDMSGRGIESVLYTFKANGDGIGPSSGLTLSASGGALYGTTYYGGATGNGTVFAINLSAPNFGHESVFYGFKGEPDGAFPTAGVVVQNGIVYGTTSNGGAHGAGIVFAISATGKESVLYSFLGPPDGAAPRGDLIAVNGILYGTTSGGGAKNAGTVFAVNPTGQEAVLYSFGGSPDGATPLAGLVDLNGVLYGTTSRGGANRNGTVFAVTP